MLGPAYWVAGCTVAKLYGRTEAGGAESGTLTNSSVVSYQKLDITQYAMSNDLETKYAVGQYLTVLTAWLSMSDTMWAMR